ncbi:MAG: hypothetical protein ACI8W8_003513, partial [Rhodothermales bacterium]
RGITNSTLALVLSYRGLLAVGIALLLLCGWLPNAFLNLGFFAIAVLFLLALPVIFCRCFESFDSLMTEAFKMEALAKTLNSRLISAIGFMEQALDTSLTRLVIDRAVNDLDGDFESKLSRLARDAQLKRTAITVVIVAVMGAALGGRVAANISESWTIAYNTLYPVTYVLSPDSSKPQVHSLGESVPISIQFNRDSITNVTLILQAGEDEPEEIALAVVGKRAEHILSSKIQRDYRATFRFADRETETIHVVFTTNPVLENMQVELLYPSYTRLLPKSLEGIQQRIIGVARTRTTFGFTFSKDIARATFAWDDGSDVLDLDVVGRFASISLIHSKARTATLQVEDIHGLALEEPFLIQFDVQEDEKPRVQLPRFLKQDMPMKLAEAKTFSFGARLEDDFGVARCVLSWKKSTVNNPNAVTEKGEVERLITPPRRKGVADFAKAFESMPLLPGDKISFQIHVFDNHKPSAQSAKSSTRSFFIHQDELDDWDIRNAGFGGKTMVGKIRIKKTKRDTTVKNPEGLRTKEKFQNEFELENTSTTQTATVRGKHQKATSNYFRLITELASEDGGTE